MTYYRDEPKEEEPWLNSGNCPSLSVYTRHGEGKKSNRTSLVLHGAQEGLRPQQLEGRWAETSPWPALPTVSLSVLCPAAIINEICFTVTSKNICCSKYLPLCRSCYFKYVFISQNRNENQQALFPPHRICEDFIAKNVRNNEVLRNQLPLLPPKLLTTVQRRISFYRPSKKQTIS